jgi:A/G-specific adenine glycosylase
VTLEQCETVLNDLGITACKISDLPPSKHIFTHLEWHMKGYLVSIAVINNLSDFVWASKGEISSRYSIPTAFKSYIKEALL